MFFLKHVASSLPMTKSETLSHLATLLEKQGKTFPKELITQAKISAY
jgi:hypothetical protein